MPSSSLSVAVTHLNAPVGPVLTVEELAQALLSGSVASLNKKAAAIVSYLFIELDPSLIASCVAEAGSDLRRANRLYEEAVQAHVPRVPGWEEAVEHLI
jgi:hypothetical protein